MTYAFCWRSGKIEFGSKVPGGARPLGRGDKAFCDRVEAHARLAYDGKTLLVPGVPEAATNDDALLAVRLFIKWAIKQKPLSGKDIRASYAATGRSLRRQKAVRQ